MELRGAGPTTRLWLCHDDVALYVAFECLAQAGRVPVATAAERDGVIWQDDRVEIRLQKDVRRDEQVRFIVSVAGVVFDAVQRGAARLSDYNPEWLHAVERSPERWVVEMAVPLAALGLQQWPVTMGFNAGREGQSLEPVGFAPPHEDTSRGVLRFKADPSEDTAGRDAGIGQRDPDAPEELSSGGALTVEFERLYCRPGECWLVADVQVRPRGGRLDATRLLAQLYGLGDSEPRVTESVVPSRHHGRLEVSLRNAGLRRGRVVVQLLEGQQRTGVSEHFVEVRGADPSRDALGRIPVRIDWPAEVAPEPDWPVTFGVPFAAGALWESDGLRVVDSAGRAVPHQAEVVGRWAPEGSVKWVRIDAVVSGDGGLFVEVVGPGAEAGVPASGLTVSEAQDRIVLDTGPARFVLALGSSPVAEVWQAGELRAASSGRRGLYIIDQRGRLARASSDGETMRLEARGPVAACVRFEGPYRTADGEELARHITRVEAFAGQPFARVTHTLVLTQDTNEVWFADVGWELSVKSGEAAHGWFGTSRTGWQDVGRYPLDAAPVLMLQDKHVALGAGENHFVVARVGDDGGLRPLLEGEECGDWVAQAGAAGGLMLACNEAARQHPKEFEIRQDRAVLHLFSSRGGAQLDFRTDALLERWRLREWYERVLSGNAAKVEEYLGKVRGYESNAIGWAKTHELLLVPLGAGAAAERCSRYSRLLSHPVHAVVEPSWLCASGAFGPIHPRDPERFPLQERIIDKAFAREESALARWGDYGFVDYFAGPHYQTGNLRRYSLTYTLRGDLWLTYVRSGDPRVRAFISASDKSYMDNLFSHWDGPGRIRGLLHSPGGDLWNGYGKHALPFYWEGVARLETSSTTNFNNFMWLYYLTGYRRAKDVLQEYIDGVKRFWTPTSAGQSWRVLMAFRLLAQAYQFSWDPEVRAMLDATADRFLDPMGELGLSKERPYRSSTYKTQVDVRALLEAAESTGSCRYREVAARVSHYWWRALLGAEPLLYTNPQGPVGSFLFGETGDTAYAQGLAIQLRQIAAMYDAATGEIGAYGRSAGTFIFEGIAYAEAVVAQVDADRRPAASWLAYQDFGCPTRIVTYKHDDAVVEIDVRRYGGAAGDSGSAGDMTVRPLLLERASGQTLNRMLQQSNDVGSVRLPRDSAEGAYEILPGRDGSFFALAHGRVPLVLHAPSYWRPMPSKADPPYRWFFSVPDDARDAQIFFEGTGRLFTPAGSTFEDGEPVHGWVDLPAEQSGLWSFEPVLNQLVRVRNVPPFFAVQDAESYFLPPIPWEREPIPAAPPAVGDDVQYVAGAIDTSGNQALFLVGKRAFKLLTSTAGDADTGNAVLPFEQGTIEFFMKPTWSTFDLPAKVSKLVLRLTTEGSPWSLCYQKRPDPTWRYRSHVLYAEFYVEGAAKPARTPAYLQALFERDQWVHVAWVWGLREVPTHRGRKSLLATQLFLDGKPSRAYEYARELPPKFRPLSLQLGPGIDAAVDELRISAVQRYTEAFTPPHRGGELKLDEPTLALFHFDGTSAGERYGGRAVQGTVE